MAGTAADGQWEGHPERTFLHDSQTHCRNGLTGHARAGTPAEGADLSVVGTSAPQRGPRDRALHRPVPRIVRPKPAMGCNPGSARRSMMSSPARQTATFDETRRPVTTPTDLATSRSGPSAPPLPMRLDSHRPPTRPSCWRVARAASCAGLVGAAPSAPARLPTLRRTTPRRCGDPPTAAPPLCLHPPPLLDRAAGHPPARHRPGRARRYCPCAATPPAAAGPPRSGSQLRRGADRVPILRPLNVAVSVPAGMRISPRRVHSL